VVDAMWRNRVVAGMESNTVRTYASAFRSFVEYFESMRWVDPYLGRSVASDLVRVVSWINHLTVDRGLVKATVGSYLTAAKQQLTVTTLGFVDGAGTRKRSSP
jgi:hypothetical protein